MDLNELKQGSYEDLEFAKVDHSREARSGFPEVVFCERKTEDQVAQIMKAIYDRSGLVLGTRANAAQYDAVKAVLPDAVFYEKANVITAGEPREQIGNVAICTAGTTDIPVAEEAALTAYMCGAEVHRYYDVGVAGITAFSIRSTTSVRQMPSSRWPAWKARSPVSSAASSMRRSSPVPQASVTARTSAACPHCWPC